MTSTDDMQQTGQAVLDWLTQPEGRAPGVTAAGFMDELSRRVDLYAAARRRFEEADRA